MSNVVSFQPRSGVIVSNVRRIGKGALVSIFDVDIPAWHIVIKDCKLFEKDGRSWIGMASTSFTGSNGRTAYKNLVEFTDDIAKERFEKAVLEDLR